MGEKAGLFASALRRELGARNRLWARGRAHVESYGKPPVIVYSAEESRHGNFFNAAYEAICARPEWMRRFDKIHAQGKSLPKPETGPNGEPGRRWREIDSSMSSDALLMNVFCTPGVVEAGAVERALGVDGENAAVFGWKARVALKSGRFDRTEVDMRWGSLLVEAKLTEGDFQTCKAEVVERYRDFDSVFDRELLPRMEVRTARRKEETEFPEDYSQEFEGVVEGSPSGAEACPFLAGSMYGLKPVPFERVGSDAGTEVGYAGYQLIRNVLAAYAEDCSFCVLHDARRPDLREAWFAVMAAVKSAEMRVRLKVLTWQELAEVLPCELQEFLDLKYGIVEPRTVASSMGDSGEFF